MAPPAANNSIGVLLSRTTKARLWVIMVEKGEGYSFWRAIEVEGAEAFSEKWACGSGCNRVQEACRIKSGLLGFFGLRASGAGEIWGRERQAKADECSSKLGCQPTFVVRENKTCGWSCAIVRFLIIFERIPERTDHFGLRGLIGCITLN
jgi:hypothetical protein